MHEAVFAEKTSPSQIPHMFIGASTFGLGMVRCDWPKVLFFQFSTRDQLMILFSLDIVINIPGASFYQVKVC